MSCAMARRVIADRKNSRTDSQCLKGIIPVVEDWHSKLCFLTVSLMYCNKRSYVWALIFIVGLFQTTVQRVIS